MGLDELMPPALPLPDSVRVAIARWSSDAKGSVNQPMAEAYIQPAER